MKPLFTFFLLTTFFLFSCTNTQRKGASLTDETSSAEYVGPIIDMHIHAFSEDHPMFGMTHPPTLRGETYQGVESAQDQREKTIEKLRKHNVVKAIVTDGMSWHDQYPELVLVSSARGSASDLKEQHEEGNLQAIAEMAPFYGGVLADDESMLPYFDMAESLGIPVGFHVFPGGPNYGIHLMPEMLGGMRVYNASPLQLEDVLIKFPNLKLYVMHGGWPYVEDMKALMYAHPNIYVDIAVVNWILPQSEFEAYLNSLITSGFGDRIMYGTDQMVWPETIDIGIESVHSADFLTLEQKEDIFYDNAARFLGLSEDEIQKHKSIN
jgi:predicted TIM-barrel fold metal-dependent hydrolase